MCRSESRVENEDSPRDPYPFSCLSRHWFPKPTNPPPPLDSQRPVILPSLSINCSTWTSRHRTVIFFFSLSDRGHTGLDPTVQSSAPTPSKSLTSPSQRVPSTGLTRPTPTVGPSVPFRSPNPSVRRSKLSPRLKGVDTFSKV